MKNHCFLQHVGSETRVGYIKTLFTNYKALVTLVLLFITLGAWSQAVFQIKSPASIKGFYAMQIGDSTTHFWGNGSIAKKSVEAELLLATGADSLVSSALGVKYQGKIAVVFRGGGVNYADKALRAQDAGAVAVLIVNHGVQADGTVKLDEVLAMNSGAISYTDGSSGTKVKIPVAMISKNTYLKLSPILRSGEKVLGYIGGKQVAKNDIKLDLKYVLTPARLTNLSLLAQANDIIDSLGLELKNNGSEIQDSILCEVIIKYGSDILHQDKKSVIYKDDSGNNVTTIPPGEGIGYITFKPFKNTQNLKPGKYTLTYSAYSTIKGKEDEFITDNTVEIPFFINDSIYSPTVVESWNRYIFKDSVRDSNGKPVTPAKFIYDTLRYKNQPKFSTFYQPSASSNFKSHGPCIVLRDANASRIKGVGLTFTASNYSSTEKSYKPLKDELFKINVFEWAGNYSFLSGFNEYNIKLIQNQEYIATSINSWDYLTARFADEVKFENDKRYLICVESSNTNMRFAYDTLSADLTVRSQFYDDQPLNMVTVDGRYSGKGFGLNKIPAMALTVRDGRYESSEKELVSFGLKAPDSTKIEIFYDKITLQVPKGTDLTNLVPTFTSSEKSKVYVNGVRQVSGVTANNFAKKIVEYVVVAEDGTKKSYYVTVNYCTSKNNKIYHSQEAYCPNEEVYFNLSSHNSYNIKEKTWNFGNGKYYTQNDSYGSVQTSYSKTGIYTVSVSYINSECFNALDTTSVQVTISDKVQPNSDFYLSKTSFCPNEPFSANASSYNEASYTWDMGDETIYTGTTINHRYKEGDNTIKLTVTNACGNTSTTSKTVTVTSSVHADFLYEDPASEYCVNEEFSIRYSNMGIKSYEWIGQGLVKQEQYSTHTTGYFKLSNYGEYNMQLKLTSFCGKDTILTKKITIIKNKPFQDRFLSGFVKSYCPGEEVEFYASDFNKNYKLAEYNYGDGKQGTKKTHRYDAFGEYTLQLKLTNYCDKDTTIQAIVRIAPDTIYRGTTILVNDCEDVSYCQFNELHFGISKNPYYSAEIKSVIWNFGDGTPEVDNSNPSHRFAKSGLLTVKAKLTSYCGDTLTIFKKINLRNDVGYKGLIDASIPNAVCPGENANFSIYPGLDGMQWFGDKYFGDGDANRKMYPDFKAVAWDFGDGTLSTKKSSFHSYAKTGIYTVTMKLTNNCNVDTLITTSVEVRNDVTPYIPLRGVTDEICPGEKVVFFQSAYSRDYQLTYDFGDNSKEYTMVDSLPQYNSVIISHKYLTKGTYHMKLIAKNKCGLSESTYRTITVKEGLKLSTDTELESEKISENTAIFFLESNGSEFTWNFGKNDIVKTDVGYIKHGFTSTGDKNVSVFVKTACGDTATYYTQVSIFKGTTLANVTSCGNYLWNNKVYTKSGTYSNVLTNKQGFDSIVTLQLTIYSPSKSSKVYKAKGSYTWNGVNYTKSGIYTFTTKNVHGCDSVATLELTIDSQGTSTTSIATCGSYDWNGKKYTQSGSYTYTTKTAQGNDSTATLYLTINSSSTSSISQVVCGSYDWKGKTYTSSGKYDYITKNSKGCDSIVTLNLTINDKPSVSATLQNGSLAASTSNDTYQWLDCDADPIANATTQTYLPTQTGNYAVKVSLKGCEATSACVKFDLQTTGLADANHVEFRIYPNPNQGVFNIAGLPTGSYKIINLMGAEVFQFTVDNTDAQLVNLSHLAKGVYQVASEEHKLMHNKIVITD